MQHLSVVTILSAVYLMSIVQCQQTEQQTIKVQPADDLKTQAEENIVAATEQLKAKIPTREGFYHENVILPGVSFFNKLKSHVRNSAPGRTHIRVTSIPHMMYKNRRMNPIRNHLEAKNDRRMMKPKGSYMKYKHV